MAKRRTISAEELEDMELGGATISRPEVIKAVEKALKKPLPIADTQELINTLEGMQKPSPVKPIAMPAAPAINAQEIAKVIREGFEQVSGMTQSAPEPKAIPNISEFEIDILERETNFPHQAIRYKVRCVYHS
jgi:hypothetical protein